jgi:hypothetical protein|tara:strand:+ start:1243 stop:1968 length:726 start_codon:yes stop_codon:yes gene_type:complete
MNKQKLVRFINKYYLNGIADSVVLKSNAIDQKLSTRFVSSDKTLLGKVEMDRWNFEDANIGVYTTEQLLKLLGVLDEDINVSVMKAGDKTISMKVSDLSSSVNYMLSDPSIINEPPQLQNIPNFELSINMTPSVINKFISGKSALQDTTTFTVITDETLTKLVIGYSSVNTNRVTIPVVTSEFSSIDNVSFNAEYFSNILIANKECESAFLQISSEGLAKINFKIDDYTATYWLVATSEVD